MFNNIEYSFKIFNLVIHASIGQHFVSVWCYCWVFEQLQLFTSKSFCTWHLLTLACCFVHFMCQLGSTLHFQLCIVGFQLHHCCFFYCFCLLFLSIALQYILAFVYTWSIITVDVCIFMIFKLTNFTFIYGYFSVFTKNWIISQYSPTTQ